MPVVPVCQTHTEAVAEFQCDSCGKYLCAQCAEEGHRLFFCALCGERAIPLASEPSAAAEERRRSSRRNARYTFQEALLYPFRGLGGYLYWSIVGVMMLGALPILRFFAIVFELAILLVLPGLLLLIARTSAEGEIELPDWPDWWNLRGTLSEWFRAALAVGVSLLPAIITVSLLGCGFLEFEARSLLCALGLGAGLILSAALWIPAFGAVAVSGRAHWALRIDLHVRALFAVGSGAWKTLGLLVVLMALRVVVSGVSSRLPVLSAVVPGAAGAYTLFVAAHLSGLLFRRHPETLRSIYS